jgi:hypothetical protein
VDWLRWRLRLLARRVDAANDLSLDEWVALYRDAVDSQPDLLLEVGRGCGNSTVALTEAANRELAGVPVVSVGMDGTHAWEARTVPRLRRIRRPRWFRPLTVIEGWAQEVDLAPWLDVSERVFLFWDAHGPELAVHMLERVLPRLPSGSRIVVHDIYPLSAPEGNGPVFRHTGYWSPFEELPLIGRWADDHGLRLEDLGGMVAITL